jgi:non-homologous end joining protein Ku
MLVDQMSGEGWDPSEHPNAYRKALRKLLASKKRFAIGPAEKSGRAADNVVELMDALKKSLGQSRSASRRAPTRRRAGAA